MILSLKEKEMEQLSLNFNQPESGDILLKDLESNHYRPIEIIAAEHFLSEVELNEPVSIDEMFSFFEGQEQGDLNG